MPRRSHMDATLGQAMNKCCVPSEVALHRGQAVAAAMCLGKRLSLVFSRPLNKSQAKIFGLFGQRLRQIRSAWSHSSSSCIIIPLADFEENFLPCMSALWSWSLESLKSCNNINKATISFAAALVSQLFAPLSCMDWKAEADHICYFISVNTCCVV